MLGRLIVFRFVLTILQVLSIFGVIAFGLVLNKNYVVVSRSNEYKSDIMVVDTVFSFSTGSPGNSSRVVEGIVSGYRKSISLNKKTQTRDSVGNWGDLLVWNIPKEKEGYIELRTPKQKEFPVKKYKNRIYKFIFYGYLPILLIWIVKYIVSRKIRRMQS